jgi:hypothetical protein
MQCSPPRWIQIRFLEGAFRSKQRATWRMSRPEHKGRANGHMNWIGIETNWARCRIGYLLLPFANRWKFGVCRWWVDLNIVNGNIYIFLLPAVQFFVCARFCVPVTHLLISSATSISLCLQYLPLSVSTFSTHIFGVLLTWFISICTIPHQCETALTKYLIVYHYFSLPNKVFAFPVTSSQGTFQRLLFVPGEIISTGF